jgi:hypothetical protein|tara:strand:+ start:563 stop:688 length:126 start_codon:yes stop_codon:yes gene_type:complete
MLLLVPQVMDVFMTDIGREVKRQGREKVWSRMMAISGKLPF